MERRLARLERLASASRATYLGNGRVLVGLSVAGRELMFFLDAEDRLITPWVVSQGTYDEALTGYLAATLPADAHVIDVGANFGYYTCLAGMLAPRGRVIGIEPDAASVVLARDNVAINGLYDRASILHAAADDAGRDVTLFRRIGRAGNTSIAAPAEAFTTALGEAPVERFTVPGVRVDDLLPQLDGRLDFLKVDVEGAEPLVLAGARAAIAANLHITIALEWSPGQMQAAGFDAGELAHGFAAGGLRAYRLHRGGLVSMSQDALTGTDYLAAVILRHG